MGKQAQVRKGGRKVGGASGDEIKAQLIRMIGEGMLPAGACERLGRAVSTYRWHRRTDPQFAATVDRVRAAAAAGEPLLKIEVPEFAEFRERYLGQVTWSHQQQWVDLLEGKEPQHLHEAVEYREGRPAASIELNRLMCRGAWKIAC